MNSTKQIRDRARATSIVAVQWEPLAARLQAEALSLADLCRLANVSYATLWRIRQRGTASKRVLRALARALKVPAQALIASPEE